MYKLIDDDSPDIVILKKNEEIIRLKGVSVFKINCEIYLKGQIVLKYKYRNIFGYEKFKILKNNLSNDISFINKYFKLKVLVGNKMLEIQYLWFPFLRRKTAKILLNKNEIGYIETAKNYSLNIHFFEGYHDVEIISLILFLIKRNFDSWM